MSKHKEGHIYSMEEGCLSITPTLITLWRSGQHQLVEILLCKFAGLPKFMLEGFMNESCTRPDGLPLGEQGYVEAWGKGNDAVNAYVKERVKAYLSVER